MAQSPVGKLILIDGHSLLHRAFFALPPLTNAGGQPTGAVYGFLSMLIKLVGEERPSHLAVAVDMKGPTFRHERFTDYKGHRPSMPDDLAVQIPLLHEAMAALTVPVVGVPSFEADDVIGTLAKRAAREGFEVTIVTGDRDALQLIDDHIRVLLTRKGISELELYDASAVADKYGLTPRQLIDVKGLMGDASDNIPGVPGVGEKTAFKLIQQFGSLEEALARASEAPGKKLPELLKEHAEQAALSKQLATIHCQVPIEMDWDACRLSLNSQAAADFFRRMEFRTLLRRLEEQDSGAQEPQEAAKAFSETAAIQVESVAPGGWRAHGQDESLALALRWRADGPGLLQPTTLALHDGAKVVAGPVTAPQEVAWLGQGKGLRAGYELKPLLNSLMRAGQTWQAPVFDAQVAAYLLDPNRSRYRLEDLVQHHFSETLNDDGSLEALGRQAEAVARLLPVLTSALQADGLWEVFTELEMPLTPVLAAMEAKGVCIDRAELDRLGARFALRIAELEAEIYDAAGERFNINSTQQLGSLLFDKLGLPPLKKTKTGYSTDAEVLEQLAAEHPLPAKVVEYRHLVKLQSTYIEGLRAQIHPATGRIHTTFNQTVAATGRLSSIEPNLQNIPVREELGRQIRRVFVAPPGHVLLAADYSQIELRLLAHFSEDASMVRAFQENADIHRATAAQVFGVAPEDVTEEMRSAAKAVNFGVVYGISDFGLGRNLGIARGEAKTFIDGYFDKYPGVKRFLDRTVAEAHAQGYVRTMSGRKRQLPDLRNRNYARRQFAERAAMNTPLQGSAADLIKRAMLRAQAAIEAQGLASSMILQVHDELIFEVPEAEVACLARLVTEAMEGVAELRVPLRVDVKVGPNWYDMEELPRA